MYRQVLLLVGLDVVRRTLRFGSSENIDLDAGELAGRNALLEQVVELGETSAGWFWDAEECVDNTETTDTSL